MLLRGDLPPARDMRQTGAPMEAMSLSDGRRRPRAVHPEELGALFKEAHLIARESRSLAAAALADPAGAHVSFTVMASKFLWRAPVSVTAKRKA